MVSIPFLDKPKYYITQARSSQVNASVSQNELNFKTASSRTALGGSDNTLPTSSRASSAPIVAMQLQLQLDNRLVSEYLMDAQQSSQLCQHCT